jgi:conjugal transfer mating pair stabilization protein TraG
VSANDAGAATFNIRKENFSNLPSATLPDTPSAENVISPAEDIHRRNIQEESGKGRIHTDALGLAKDMAGLNADGPLRPSDEFYRNQSFYYGGTLVQPQGQEKGIVLPSGRVLYGDADYVPPKKDEEFFKGSVFEKDKNRP